MTPEWILESELRSVIGGLLGSMSKNRRQSEQMRLEIIAVD